jgi:WS/DGAT/MGAT family acyltransferase
MDTVRKGGVMERLNPLDALFVDAEDEDRHTSMAIASIAVFEGPAPSYEEFFQAVSGRLALVPIYRRKLRTVPFRLGRPVWVDDPHFDLHYHLRRTALPAPGGDEQLSNLMARVMGQRLDRDYPLWEYWLVEGLSEGRWALISKVHHCMVDGVSATDLYRVIFDFSPEPAPPVVDDRTVPPEPSALSLAVQAAVDMVVLPVREASTLSITVAADPGEVVRQVSGTLRAIGRLAPSLWPAAGSSLSGRIGQQRRYLWAHASLDEVKMIKRELGGTVNDVVLAAISGGFRALLLSRGEEPEPHKVPSLVPVSLRAPGTENIYENQVSALVAYLPVHVADPVERLAAVRAELSDLKENKEERVGEALLALGRYTPFPVTSRWVQLLFSLPQREIVTVTTNVPGPQQPLYGMGRKLLEIIPYVPIATTVRTGVSIFTYCGNMTFGVTGDFAANPDLDVLARGIEDGIAELADAARHPRRATAAAATPTAKPPSQPHTQPPTAAASTAAKRTSQPRKAAASTTAKPPSQPRKAAASTPAKPPSQPRKAAASTTAKPPSQPRKAAASTPAKPPSNTGRTAPGGGKP